MEKMSGEKIRMQIVKLLKEREIPFEHHIHKSAPDSITGATETGVPLNQVIKSLLLRGKKSGKNYLAGMLGDQRIDMKSFSLLVGEPCEFESVQVLQERFGLEVGGVTPFLGLLFGFETYFDERVLNCDEAIFGTGLPTESFRMKVKELIALIHPKMAQLSKK